MAGEVEPFGWSLAVDVYDCDVRLLECAEHIERFSVELCDDVLEMRRFGPPLIEWFGTSSPKTAGYSLVQLIETSNVVAHFSGARRSAHFDVFSCQAFSPDAVEEFCRVQFRGGSTETTFLERR